MNNQFANQGSRLKKIIFIICAVIAVALILIGAAIWEKRYSLFPDDGSTENEGKYYYEGKWYEERDKIETMLIIGLDKFGESLDHESSYNNDQQADFLMLLVIDKETNACSAIHINRDTMAEVTVLGVGGTKVGTVTEQIALSHTYGSGDNDSCRNTVRAVSTLLRDIDIDYYVSMTMDAVQILNDMVGGVEVKVLDDLTFIDESLKKDETVTLTGELALKYVRNRYGLEDSSNIGRMNRQRQYIDALYDKTIAFAAENDDFSSEVLLELSDCLVSNLSVTHAEEMLDTISSYTKDTVYTIDGEIVKGEKYMEFYADEASIESIIIKLFYKEIQAE